MPAPDLDPVQLARIVAPFTADAAGPGAPTIAIEDARGTVIVGRRAEGGTAVDRRSAVTADIRIDDDLVGRVTAETPTPDPTTRAIVTLVALAVTELVIEIRARRAAEGALQDERSAATAAALGTDARELAKGRRQQRSIVSLVPPDVPGYDLGSHYAAAREIGGDLFELFRLRHRGHPLAIVVADVTGKGLDAALLMAFSRPVMHSALNAADGPAQALERTNRVLVQERRGTLFITAVHAVLRPTTGEVRIANAGHEPPLLVPADGGPIRPIGDAGVLLGAFASIEPPEVAIVLAPGDRLFFYTDGATDTVGTDGGRFGDERLLATLEAARDGTAQDLVAAVRDALERFRGTVEPADDLTLVAVGRRARRAARPTPKATS